jgi:hypothetical protein
VSATGVPIFTLDTDPTNQDRRINANTIAPVVTIQKGARLAECLNAAFASPLGSSSVQALSTGGSDTILYPQRIVNFINGQIAAGGNRAVSVQTMPCAGKGCVWTTVYTGVSPPTQTDKDAVNSKHIQYYAVMELAHRINLILPLGTHGPHTAPGTGDILDTSAVNIIGNSPSSLNMFRVPSVFIKSGDFDTFRR